MRKRKTDCKSYWMRNVFFAWPQQYKKKNRGKLLNQRESLSFKNHRFFSIDPFSALGSSARSAATLPEQKLALQFHIPTTREHAELIGRMSRSEQRSRESGVSETVNDRLISPNRAVIRTDVIIIGHHWFKKNDFSTQTGLSNSVDECNNNMKGTSAVTMFRKKKHQNSNLK